MRFALPVLCLPALVLSLSAQSRYPLTRSGPFWQHVVSHRQDGVGCRLSINGQVLSGSATVTLLSASATVNFRSDCTLANGLATTTFNGSVNLDAPANTPIITYDGPSNKVPDGSFPHRAAVALSFVPGVSRTPASTYDVTLTATPQTGQSGPGTGCEARTDAKTRQPKGTVSLALTPVCTSSFLRTQFASQNHGFGASREFVEILTTVEYSASENWVGSNTSITPGGGGSFTIRSQWKIAQPLMEITPSNVQIAAPLGQADAGTGIVTIRNTGGGLLDWRMASPSSTIVSTTPGAGSVVLNTAPTSGDGLLNNASATTTFTLDTTNARQPATFTGRVRILSDNNFSPIATNEVAVTAVVGAANTGPDTVSLVNLGPPPVQGLAAGDPARISGEVNYSLGSRDQADLSLEAADANGRVLATTAAVRVNRGTATAGPFLLNFTVPANAGKVRVRALLTDGPTLLKAGDYTDYALTARPFLLIAAATPPDGAELYSGTPPDITATASFSLGGLPAGKLELRLLDASGTVLQAIDGGPVAAGAPIESRALFMAPKGSIPDSATAVDLVAVMIDAATGSETFRSAPVQYRVRDPQLVVEYGRLSPGGIFEPFPANTPIRGGLEIVDIAFRVKTVSSFAPANLIFRQYPNPFLLDLRIGNSSGGISSEYRQHSLDSRFSGPQTAVFFTKTQLRVVSPLLSFGQLNLHLTLHLQNQWGQESPRTGGSFLTNEINIRGVQVQADTITTGGDLVAGKAPFFRIPILLRNGTSNPADIECQLDKIERVNQSPSNLIGDPVYTRLATAAPTSPIRFENAGFAQTTVDLQGPVLRESQTVRLHCTMKGAAGELASDSIDYIVTTPRFSFPIGASTLLAGNVSFGNVTSGDSAEPFFLVEKDQSLSPFGGPPAPSPGTKTTPLARAAAVIPADFQGISKVWQFSPPTPASSGFRSQITIRYPKWALPDDPGFREEDMKIVSVDAASGRFESYATVIDAENGTATANIEGIQELYSIGVVGAPLGSSLFPPVTSGGYVDQQALAITNTASSPAPVRITDEAGQPAELVLPPSAQATHTAPATHGRSDTAGVHTLALLSSARGAAALPLPRQGSMRVLLTGIQPASEVHVLNATNFGAVVNLSYVSAAGQTTGSATFPLASRRSRTERVLTLFPDLQAPIDGYIVIDATQPIAAAHLLGSPGTLAALAAQTADSIPSGAQTFSAPLLFGAGAETELHLVNTGRREAVVTIRAFSEAGSVIGQPDSARIPASGSYSRSASTAFGLTPATATPGSILIDVEGQVAGDVLFGDTAGRMKAFAPLARASGSWLIPYIASGNGRETILSLGNSSPSPTTAEVRVLRPDGSVTGTRHVPIPGRGRFIAPLATLLPASTNQTGGHILIQGASLTAVALIGPPALDRDAMLVAGVDLNTGSSSPPPAAPAISVARNLDFGLVPIGQAADARLVLFNTGAGPLNITPAAVAAPFQLISGASSTIAPGQTTPLSLRFTPSAAGTVSAVLTIASNDPANPQVSISLTGTGVPPSGSGPVLELTPQRLDFGTLAIGESSRELTLQARNRGDANLTINTITSSNPAFRVTIPPPPIVLAPGSVQSIQIRFTPSGAGVQSGTLTFASNAPVATVDLTGISTAPVASPVLSLSASTLDFGRIASGQSREIPLVVQNTGTGSLTLTSFRIEGAGFTLPQGEARIDVAPAAQRVVSIRFLPSASGTVTGSLTFATNDPARPSAVVSLRGEGTTEATVRSVLLVDDSVYEQSAGFPNGTATAYFMNRLTPATYPATLKSVQIAWLPESGLSATQPVTILYAASPSGSATFAGGQFRALSSTVVGFGRFVEYTVPDVTITSGDFLVGFMTANPAGTFPASVDSTPPNRNRSYASTDGAAFAPLGIGNLGIRAVVETNR